MLRRIGWLVRKDLGLFFADRNGALMAFVLPVLLASLIGMLFSPRAEVGRVDLLVVDEDGGPAVAALVASLDGEAAIAVERATLEDARARLASGRSSVALWLPRGASAALEPSRLFIGEPGAATLLYDPSRHIEVELVFGFLQRAQLLEAARRLESPQARLELFQDLASKAEGPWSRILDRALAQARAEAARTVGAGAPGTSVLKMPLDVAREAIVAAGPGSGYDSYAHNFAGMLCMFLLFLAQDMAKGLVAERQAGVLVRTRLSSSRPLEPLLATTASTTLLGLLLTAAVFSVAIAVFGVVLRGGAFAFAVVALAYALFGGAFAALLAGLARTDKQISAIGTATILIVSFVGGAWYPRFMMPEWLQEVSAVLPTTFATEGFAAATWRGLPLEHALAPAAALMAWAIGCVALGRWRFRWG